MLISLLKVVSLCIKVLKRATCGWKVCRNKVQIGGVTSIRESTIYTV